MPLKAVLHSSESLGVRWEPYRGNKGNATHKFFLPDGRVLYARHGACNRVCKELIRLWNSRYT